jgi:acyl-coenzyme A synthetase/AMP-(fatty) acid ligase
MRLDDMVSFWGRTISRRPAIIRPEGIVTYKALSDSIEFAASHFSGLMLEPDKPVAIASDNPVTMLVASLGLLRAGFSIVPVSKSLLEHLPQTGANTLVYERDGATLDGGTNILFEDSWLSVGTRVSTVRRAPRPRPAREPSAIFFTSGTTGKPKPIVQTQQAWEQRVLFSNNSVFSGYERALIVPGLSGAFGMNRAFEVLYAGKTACFAPFGQPTLWLVNTYDVDLMIASIQQALALADIQEKITRYPLASLKTLRIGGSVIAAEGVERLKSHLCTNVILSYASTEAGTAAIAPYDVIAHIPDAVGYVAPGVEVEIVDHLGTTLPIGSEGFIRLRSPQFIKNFGPGSEANWFYPGDLGSLTEDGVLCVMGRSGDVVNRGGTKLSSTEFENFLMKCAGVKDAGICTHMGDAGYEEIWAGVVLDPSIDLGAFRHHIESNAFGQNIDRLFVVESVPRNELGKIQSGLLKEMLQAINKETTSPA